MLELKIFKISTKKRNLLEIALFGEQRLEVRQREARGSDGGSVWDRVGAEIVAHHDRIGQR